MRENAQKGIAHIILILIILLAALTVWLLVSKPWQAKQSASVQKPSQKTQAKPQEFPQTNPFEVKTNPFKDIKTNPFE